MEEEELITDFYELQIYRTYTYADYKRWYFKERVELIRGKIRKIPSPDIRHQTVLLDIFTKFHVFFQDSLSWPFMAPFDVRLPVKGFKNVKGDNVVQPDLCVICNATLIDEQGCNGAPDLVIEVLSRGNCKHELQTKFKLYQASGVKEYWIIRNRYVLVYTLKNGLYVGLRPRLKGDTIESPLFPDLKIAVSDIFRM